MRKIYIIAGESSGDFIGSKILGHLKKHDIKFKGIGGKLMEEEGVKSLFPISKINLMGFLEIVPHIFNLRKLIKLTVQDIIKFNPDILITVDSPGFTYRIAKKIKALNPEIKLVHIVAPSVWAYKPARAKKYAKLYDLLLALLPFEPPYFTKLGLHCICIGHPILEQQFINKANDNLSREIKICITAGSREGEIKRHAEIFIKAINLVAAKHPNITVTFVLAQIKHKELIEQFRSCANFEYDFSENRLEAYSTADIALAKSGTNTLEIAASKTPSVIAYKVNYFSYLIIRSLIKVKYVSLINIMADSMIIPEFIQNDCNPEKISKGLLNLVNNKDIKQKQIEESLKILDKLRTKSGNSPSLIAAREIIKFLDIIAV